MSEIMSHVEIEDVLSSIRRLVSQDLRPTRASVDPDRTEGVVPVRATGGTAGVPTTDNKLLLTPALRVVSDRGPVPPGKPETAKTPLPRLHLGLESRLDRDSKAFDMSGTSLDSEFESDTGDPYPDVTRMEWTEDGWVLAGPEPAPEGPIDPWAAEEYSGLVQEEAFSEPVAKAHEVHEDDPAASQADDAKAAQPSLKQSGSASQPQRQDEDLEVVFDEQLLRELVRDVLREELQGRMGERMTRNIRKLVHAEIARLIATQDLD